MRNHKRPIVRVTVLVISVLTLLLAGCGDNPPGGYTYRPPAAVGDGLRVGSLDEVGVDTAWLAKAVNDISGGEYGEIHSWRNPSQLERYNRNAFHRPWVTAGS